MKPPLSIVIVLCAMAAICASVGWMGITEHQLTTGGKLGISTSSGLGAVVQGWLFIAAAFFLMGILASRSGVRNLIWLGLSVIFFSLLAVYSISSYAP